MKIMKNLFALLFFSASFFLNAQTLDGASQNVAENMDKRDDPVASDVTKLPDAQLAMSVSYYPVTAGDVYTLAFAAGGTPVRYTIPVDSTYKIRVANLGVINCAGLTYLQLKSQIESLVLRNYPMAGVQFVLTSPSTFLVSISGEVNKTIERNAWALTRLSVFLSKELTAYASRRNITIESMDGSTKTYDLFLADRKADLSQNPFLRPGDKIIISRIERKVSVTGAVERPGEYELLEGENLKELIEVYGGGLAPLADISRIELYRRVTGREGAGEKSYLNQTSLSDNFELKCYDSVYVSSYSDLRPVVFVEGAIKGSTSGSDTTGLDVSTKIVCAFNVGEDYAYFARRNKWLFTAESDLANAYIIRGTSTIPLNLNPMLYDASYYANVEIKANDTLIIPFRQYFVSVAGSVVKPGRYPYIPDRTWDYYIGLAGGFDKTKNAREAVEIYDIKGNKLSKEDFITPECTITAETNSALYYFNQYSPAVVTILSILASTLSIMAATGVLK